MNSERTAERFKERRSKVKDGRQARHKEYNMNRKKNLNQQILH